MTTPGVAQGLPGREGGYAAAREPGAFGVDARGAGSPDSAMNHAWAGPSPGPDEHEEEALEALAALAPAHVSTWGSGGGPIPHAALPAVPSEFAIPETMLLKRLMESGDLIALNMAKDGICMRTNGKSWRCANPRMMGSRYCTKHADMESKRNHHSRKRDWIGRWRAHNRDRAGVADAPSDDPVLETNAALRPAPRRAAAARANNLIESLAAAPGRQVGYSGRSHHVLAANQHPMFAGQRRMDRSRMDADVIVIGAGPAGLAAAQRLRREGLEVVVLEARHRLGGRCHTVTLPAVEGTEGLLPEVSVDLGASYMHGCCDAQPVYRLSKDLRVDSEPVDDGLTEKAAWYANGERHHIFKVKSFHAILHAAGSLLIHRTRARKEAGLEDVPIAAMMEGCLADALIERALKRLPMEKKKRMAPGVLERIRTMRPLLEDTPTPSPAPTLPPASEERHRQARGHASPGKSRTPKGGHGHAAGRKQADKSPLAPHAGQPREGRAGQATRHSGNGAGTGVVGRDGASADASQALQELAPVAVLQRAALHASEATREAVAAAGGLRIFADEDPMMRDQVLVLSFCAVGGFCEPDAARWGIPPSDEAPSVKFPMLGSQALGCSRSAERVASPMLQEVLEGCTEILRRARGPGAVAARVLGTGRDAEDGPQTLQELLGSVTAAGDTAPLRASFLRSLRAQQVVARLQATAHVVCALVDPLLAFALLHASVRQLRNVLAEISANRVEPAIKAASATSAEGVWDMVIGQLSQRLAGGGLAGLPLPGVLSRAQRAAGCLRGMAVSIMSANAVAVLHALAARDEDVADPHLAPDLWPLGPFTTPAIESLQVEEVRLGTRASSGAVSRPLAGGPGGDGSMSNGTAVPGLALSDSGEGVMASAGPSTHVVAVSDVHTLPVPSIRPAAVRHAHLPERPMAAFPDSAPGHAGLATQALFPGNADAADVAGADARAAGSEGVAQANGDAGPGNHGPTHAPVEVMEVDVIDERAGGASLVSQSCPDGGAGGADSGTPTPGTSAVPQLSSEELHRIQQSLATAEAPCLAPVSVAGSAVHAAVAGGGAVDAIGTVGPPVGLEGGVAEAGSETDAERAEGLLDGAGAGHSAGEVGSRAAGVTGDGDAVMQGGAMGESGAAAGVAGAARVEERAPSANGHGGDAVDVPGGAGDAGQGADAENDALGGSASVFRWGLRQRRPRGKVPEKAPESPALKRARRSAEETPGQGGKSPSVAPDGEAPFTLGDTTVAGGPLGTPSLTVVHRAVQRAQRELGLDTPDEVLPGLDCAMLAGALSRSFGYVASLSELSTMAELASADEVAMIDGAARDAEGRDGRGAAGEGGRGEGGRGEGGRGEGGRGEGGRGEGGRGDTLLAPRRGRMAGENGGSNEAGGAAAGATGVPGGARAAGAWITDGAREYMGGGDEEKENGESVAARVERERAALEREMRERQEMLGLEGAVGLDRYVKPGYGPFLIQHLMQGLEDSVRLGHVVRKVSSKLGGVEVVVEVPMADAEDQDCPVFANKPATNGQGVHCAVDNPLPAQLAILEARYSAHRHAVRPWRAKFAIVTVPVGVLKSKHPRSAIEFDPPLMPYKRAAIDTLGMGCENKIVLRFPHCFWNPTVPFFLTDDPRVRFVNLHALGKENVIVAHVPPPYSYYLVKGQVPPVQVVTNATASDSDAGLSNDGANGDANGQGHAEGNGVAGDGVGGTGGVGVGSGGTEVSAEAKVLAAKQLVMEILRKSLFAGEDSVPEPLQVVVTTWDADPFSLGSYSFMGVGATAGMVLDLAACEGLPGECRVYFAGEGCSLEGHQCVHGAYDTGTKAAEGIARRLLSRKDPGVPQLFEYGSAHTVYHIQCKDCGQWRKLPQGLSPENLGVFAADDENWTCAKWHKSWGTRTFWDRCTATRATTSDGGATPATAAAVDAAVSGPAAPLPESARDHEAKPELKDGPARAPEPLGRPSEAPGQVAVSGRAAEVGGPAQAAVPVPRQSDSAGAAWGGASVPVAPLARWSDAGVPGSAPQAQFPVSGPTHATSWTAQAETGGAGYAPGYQLGPSAASQARVGPLAAYVRGGEAGGSHSAPPPAWAAHAVPADPRAPFQGGAYGGSAAFPRDDRAQRSRDAPLPPHSGAEGPGVVAGVDTTKGLSREDRIRQREEIKTKIAERVAQGDSRAKRYNMPGSGLVRRPPNTRCRFCKSKHLGGCGTDEARDGCLKRPRKPGDPVPRPGRMSRRRPSASQGPGGSMSGDYGGSGTLGEGSENYSGEADSVMDGFGPMEGGLMGAGTTTTLAQLPVPGPQWRSGGVADAHAHAAPVPVAVPAPAPVPPPSTAVVGPARPVPTRMPGVRAGAAMPGAATPAAPLAHAFQAFATPGAAPDRRAAHQACLPFAASAALPHRAFPPNYGPSAFAWRPGMLGPGAQPNQPPVPHASAFRPHEQGGVL